MSANRSFGNFQDYIRNLNKEIGRAEKFFQEVQDSDRTKEEIKEGIQIILGTLQVAAYDNEIDSLTLNRNDLKELGLIMFEGKESDNFKAVKISKPHKKLDNFLGKYRDLFEEYDIYNNMV